MTLCKTTDQGFQVSLDGLNVYVTDMRTFKGVIEKDLPDQESALGYYETGFEDDLPVTLQFHECTVDKPPFMDGETEMILLLHKGFGEYTVGKFTRYEPDNIAWLIDNSPDATRLDPRDYLWSYLPNPRLYLEPV